ncbi:hypothetical protein ACVBGC_01235 [Burkholderia stagnalis]
MTKSSLMVAALGALLATCTIAAAQTPQPVAVSPWGVAPGHDSSWGTAHWASNMAAAGIYSVRGFADYPDAFNVLPHNGLEVKGILQWSPDGQPLSFPAGNLSAWRDYVRDLVGRYQGRVNAWEVWNEPPNFTADTSPASYAKIVQAAYDMAKATAPGVRIGLAAKSSHVKWLAESIDAGAAGHYDYITLHPYETAGLVRKGWEAEYMAIVPTVRKMLAEKDPARVNVPIEFTEVGIPTNWPNRTFGNAVPEQEQADNLVKFYTMGIAQGVSQIHWFEPYDGDTPDPQTSSAPFGLQQVDGRLRPAYVALKTLISDLGQKPAYLGWTDFGGAGYGFYFALRYNDVDWTVLVAWATPGKEIPLTFASPVDVVKPSDGVEKEYQAQSIRLTNSPLILSVAPGSLATAWRQTASASRIKAFPWGGDYSNATSVSIAAGEGDKGLHWIDKPAPVLVDGALAYPVAGRSGVSFTVDPQFLSWTTQRISITAVVRKMGNGDAGFNLKYESTRPVSTTDGNGLTPGPNCWCSVPAGAATTLTWVIDNPRFVGMFGVNFSLDSDSPQYSNYAIERITVTKMP